MHILGSLVVVSNWRSAHSPAARLFYANVHISLHPLKERTRNWPRSAVRQAKLQQLRHAQWPHNAKTWFPMQSEIFHMRVKATQQIRNQQ